MVKMAKLYITEMNIREDAKVAGEDDHGSSKRKGQRPNLVSQDWHWRKSLTFRRGKRPQLTTHSQFYLTLL
jgi:hypothetical protein